MKMIGGRQKEVAFTCAQQQRIVIVNIQLMTTNECHHQLSEALCCQQESFPQPSRGETMVLATNFSRNTGMNRTSLKAFILNREQNLVKQVKLAPV